MGTAIFSETDFTLINNGTISNYGNTINVKDFGAVGDGITDDASSLQDIINQSSGKTITIPDGVYCINGTITIPSEVTIIGNNCTFKQMVQGTEYSFVVDSANVKFQNIKFENAEKLIDSSNRHCDYCITTTNKAHNLKISGCYFENYRGCICPTTGTGNNNNGLIKDLVIENCEFDGYDFALLLDDFDGCSITNCIGRNITDDTGVYPDWDPPHLLYVTDRSGSPKKNLRVVNCLEVGNVYSSSYKVRNTEGVTITNCISDGCCRGIEIDQCWNVVIDGNIIQNMTITSVPEPEPSDQEENEIKYDGSQSAIWLSDVDGGVVTNNIIDSYSASQETGYSGIFALRVVPQSNSTKTATPNNIVIKDNIIRTDLITKSPFQIIDLKNSVIKDNDIFCTRWSNTYLYDIRGCNNLTVETGNLKPTSDSVTIPESIMMFNLRDYTETTSGNIISTADNCILINNSQYLFRNTFRYNNTASGSNIVLETNRTIYSNTDE